MQLIDDSEVVPKDSMRFVFDADVVSPEQLAEAGKHIAALVGETVAAQFLRGQFDVEFIEDESRAKALALELEQGPQEPCGFDFETEGWSPDMYRTNLDGEKAYIRSVSPWCPDVPLVPVCFQIYRGFGPVYVVRGEHLRLFFHWLRDLALLDGANLPFEQTVMARNGGMLPRIHRDNIHMDFLYAETLRQGRHDLKTCEEDYLGITPPRFDFPKGFGWSLDNEREKALRYAAHDAWGSRFLADVQQHLMMQLKSRVGYDSLWDFYRHCERPYSQSVALIDRAGMPVMESVTRVKYREVLDAITRVDASAFETMGRVINLSSNKDLARYFYTEKGYPVERVTKGFTCILCDKAVSSRTNHRCKEHGAGALVNTPQVDEGILEPLVKRGDKVAAHVLERRGFEKQRGSYVEPFFSRSSPILGGDYPWAEGKTREELEGLRVMHPGLKASDIVSGRLSAPLALTIPKVGFKDQVGFPEDFGWTLVDVDYAQVELRVIAELSEDPILIEAFELGRDMHSVTGALVEGYLTSGPQVLTDKGLRDQLYQDVVDAKKAVEVTTRVQHLRKRRNHGKCFHPDTEVLSRTRGWVRILDLQKDEEIAQAWPIRGGCERVELEWATPTEVIPLRHGANALTSIETDTLSMSLTPDHRTLVFRGNGFEVVTPDEVTQQDSIAPGGLLLGGRALNEREMADLRIAIATQADGSFEEDGSIALSFKKDRKVARLHMLLKVASLTYRVFPKDARGYVRFRIPPAPAVRVRKWLGKNKHLTWDLLGLNIEARRSVLDELPHWDSNIEDGGFRYSTKHADCAGIVQALAVTLGRRARVSADREWWRTRVADEARSDHKMSRMVRNTAPFTDLVACLSVPSTFVLCRYQGTTFISGQTLNFAVLYGAGADKLANDLGVSLAEARQIMHAIKSAYVGMTGYIERKIREMREGEPVMLTLGGRRRVIMELQSPNEGTRAEGERLTTNQSAQAGARDLIMAAMIQILLDQEAGGAYGNVGRGTFGHWNEGVWTPDFSTLPKAWGVHGLPPALANGLGDLGRWKARVINQIHDELLLVAPTVHAEQVLARVVKLMEDPWGHDLVLKVLLRADGTIGRNWQIAKGQG